METVVMSFCGLCLLLVLGKIVRTAIPLFQRLYLPASVIGGLIGLLWINTFGKEMAPEWHSSWGALPGFLINIVFAALFIGAKIPKMKTIWNEAAPQLCMGQLLAWGQYVIGLGLAATLLIPLCGVNKAFGNLLENAVEACSRSRTPWGRKKRRPLGSSTSQSMYTARPAAAARFTAAKVFPAPPLPLSTATITAGLPRSRGGSGS